MLNESFWNSVSPQQADVVKFIIEEKGSLELMARAGCGKSYTIKKAVHAIVDLRLGEVAALAFNKPIATELKDHFTNEKYDWRVAQAGTVHSFGFSAWRRLAPHVKVDDKKVFNIISSHQYDRHDGATYVEFKDQIRKLVGYAKQRAFGHIVDIDDMDEWMDIWNHFGMEDDVPENTDYKNLFCLAMDVYKESLRQCYEVIDFDDMILAPLYYKARFFQKDFVFLDEAQDTNPARRALALALLKPRTGRLIFVGDDKQAIYSFTGADSDSMQKMREATRAKTLPLNVTRRCPKAVVREAQKYVPDFIAYEEAEEGVCRQIDFANLETEQLTSKDAILCRNTAPLVETCYSLLAKGIACRIEGRDIAASLINLVHRWSKVKTLDQLLNKLDDHEQKQTAKFLAKNQEERIQKLVDQIDCVKILINACIRKNKQLVSDLVSDIESMFGDTPEGQEPNVLTLSTVHRSKGREWQRVYILNRDKYMPSPYAKKDHQLEQENNLIYVAITRALKELIDVN